MNAEDQYRFMQSIREYPAKYPGDVPNIVNAAHQGVQDRLKETTERAANMEAALALSLSHRLKTHSGFIASILSIWNGRSAVLWDDTISALANLADKKEKK